jgi:TrmH family RNA methyltransferase
MPPRPPGRGLRDRMFVHNRAANVKYRRLSNRAEFDLLRVVLVGTRNPLNIGAAARAMSNFGFMRLRVVNPYAPAFREARSAVGASAVLASAEEFGDVADAVADCALVVGTTAVGSRDLHHTVRRLEDGARIIRKRFRSKPVAILFGSEKIGLTNDALSHCHWLIRIPTREEHRSLNLGQAVAICLYELSRAFKAAKPPARERPATAGEVERLVPVMLEALRNTSYFKPPGNVHSEEKLRRLLRRMKLSAGDADTLVGMFRQIVWKLRAGKDSRD